MNKSFEIRIPVDATDDEFLAELNAVFVRAKIEGMNQITLDIKVFRRLIMLSHGEIPIVRAQKSWTLTTNQLGSYLSHPRSK